MDSIARAAEIERDERHALAGTLTHASTADRVSRACKLTLMIAVMYAEAYVCRGSVERKLPVITGGPHAALPTLVLANLVTRP